MNHRILLIATLMFLMGSCTIHPKVRLFNNAAEAVAISFADDTYRIASGKSHKMDLFFVDQFQIQVGAIRNTYSAENWPDEYAYFTGWWLFADREMKAQLNADGKIYLLEPNADPPISEYSRQPEGFPLVPDAV